MNTLTPMSMISDAEMSAMREYICAATGVYPSCDMTYILRFWNEKKCNIFNSSIFNGKSLIYSEPFVYQQTTEELMRDPYWTSNEFYSFKEKIKLPWYVKNSILSSKRIINQLMDEDFILNLPDDKILKVHRGEKVMRVLHKVAHAFDVSEEDFDKFHTDVSKVLNTKTVKGVLNLSIHPLDFMTSSDNSLNWHSCMNWLNEGEYRQGTVEMMNSDCVITAYISAKEPFILPGSGMAWSNKKWREYFIIGDDFVSPIKGYPYWNAELENAVAERILALLNRKNYEAINVENEGESGVLYTRDEEHLITFYTNAMYNDFCYDRHKIYVSPTFEHGQEFRYSGKSECMHCGDEIECVDEEQNLLCDDCLPSRIYCEYCDERFSESDAIYVDGVCLCPTCYEENVTTDSFYGEDHLYDRLINITIHGKNNAFYKLYLTDYILHKYFKDFDHYYKTQFMVEEVSREFFEQASYFEGYNIDEL